MGLGPGSGGPFAEAVSGLKLSCLGHGTLGDMSIPPYINQKEQRDLSYALPHTVRPMQQRPAPVL